MCDLHGWLSSYNHRRYTTTSQLHRIIIIIIIIIFIRTKCTKTQTRKPTKENNNTKMELSAKS